MSEKEVGIRYLPVEWCDSEHDSGQARDKKLEKKSQTEQHRYLEAQFSAPDCAEPVEDLDASRHADQHRGQGKKRVAGRCHADGEHVMRPHAQADEPDRARCRDHHAVAENHLAREDRDYLGGESESGNDQDINFGMAEDPEEVLPQYRRPSRLSVEEVSAEEAVE